MGFYNDKEKRVEIFENTIEQCTENAVLSAAIKESIKNQVVYLEDDVLSDVPSKENIDIENQAAASCNVIVSRKRTFEAAMPYARNGKKVCVLNFASATTPGGGVVTGSGAQEECLCRCSTLYPAISAAYGKFHGRHRNLYEAGKFDARYNDDCIFTPDVVVFKSDTVLPESMPESDWYKIDVITCAAPNLRRTTCTADELSDLHKKRLSRILHIAALNGDEVVILGAFGCGAFENPPEIVAKAEKEVVENFKDKFETIEFAVFCPPHDDKNYTVFKKEVKGN